IYDRADRELIQSGGIQVYETEVAMTDGSRREVIYHKAVFKNAEGSIGGIVGMVLDISERKRAERFLKRSEEEARRLAEENEMMARIGRIVGSAIETEEVYELFAREVGKVLPFQRISINVVDADRKRGKLAYFSGVPVPERDAKGAFPLAGSFTEAGILNCGGVIYHPHDEKEVAEKFPGLLPALRAGLRSFMMVPLVSKGETLAVLQFMATGPNLYTPENLRLALRVGTQIAGAIANAALLADRKRTEEEKALLQSQLQQAQKMEAIGTLAGGIAHDFNNILSAILGYAELAGLDLPEASRARQNLRQAIRAGHRAKDLVKQILTFSRQGKEERRPLDIGAIVKEELRFLRASLPSTIEIGQEMEDDLGTLSADPTQIHQILMNLCTNAAQAIGEQGGRIGVSLSNCALEERHQAIAAGVEPGSYVRLRVTDTGQGMTPEIMKRIFDPYFTTKEVGKGTGLGLAVVHGIVKSYGGAISVASEPGRGSTFDVYLPRIDGRGEIGADQRGEDRPAAEDEHILVVDDEQMLAEVLQEMLSTLGYRTSARTSSIEALELIRARPDQFDLVITDMTMPNMTGDKLAARMLEIRPGLPIIMCTGYSEYMDKQKAEGLGIRELLLKPLVMNELARAVRRALDKSPEKGRGGNGNGSNPGHRR
ncbi:MAG TPA: ATP-binding protein, partial [Thermodesulfobacteriota bacterium]|nr:ATP-binding protein [Thermodesulfobacteriota bacterium]